MRTSFGDIGEKFTFAVPACPYLIIIYENVAGKVGKVAYILWFNYFCQIEKATVLSLNSKRIFRFPL